MAQSRPVIEALEPGRWLTSTLELRLTMADATGSLLTALAAELRRTMPAAVSELDSFILGLDLRLADPTDQVQRIGAYEALDASLLSVGFAPRTLLLVDWILAPSLAILASSEAARAGGIAAFEGRAAAVRALRKPLLERYWQDTRYGLGNRRAFAAYHDELAPLEALLIRSLVYGTTKTSWGRFGLRHVGPPYGPAEINAAAVRLEADGWVSAIGPSKYDPNYLECARGPRARTLSERDLLAG